MQMNYKQYYKKYGLRRVSQLIGPNKERLTGLPRNSYIHYSDPSNKDLVETSIFFKDYDKLIYVDYEDTLATDKGHPVRKNLSVKALSRKFISNHKRIKFSKENFSIIKNELIILMTNYNYLDDIYRYVNNFFNDYNSWRNLQSTIWKGVEKVSNNSTRQSFITVEVGKDIPSRSLLNIYVNKHSSSLIKLFNTDSKRYILEIWKWLSVENRADSVLSQLSEKNFNKANIIFMNENKEVAILNLGYLNSWIKGQENTTDFSSITSFNSNIISKFFLKFLIEMQVDDGYSEPSYYPEDKVQVGIDSVDEKKEDKEAEEIITDKILKEEGTLEDKPELKNPEFLKEPEEKEETIKEKEYDLSEGDYNYPESSINRHKDNKLHLDINLDLSILEKKNKEELKNKGMILDKGEVVETSPFNEEKLEDLLENNSYTEILKSRIEESLKFSNTNNTSYKKHLKDLENFEKIPDPYGSGKTLKEMAIFKDEDLKLSTEDNEIIDNDLVPDKSMLKSTLLTYDRDYIQKVYKKDIISSVLNLQKANIIIKKYEIKKESTALGEYENHSISIKPIDGSPSVVKFKIPVLAEDNSFLSTGNKMSLRKQKVDLPIVKVSNDTVHLSTGYGKLTVVSSHRSFDKSDKVIIKYIISAGFNSEDDFITEISNADVYDNDFKSPYIFSLLSKNFRSLKIDNFKLFLDRKDIVKNITEINKIEGKDKVFIGKNFKTNELLFINFDNNFFKYKNNKFIPIGNINDFIGLPMNKTPMDISEVKIFNKFISIGVILSYYLGFSNLLKLLKVKFEVREGKVSLDDKEFSIIFKDVTYVFSRGNTLANLLLSGFKKYSEVLQRYRVEEFENKDVYFHLFHRDKLSPIYLRELDLLNNLFICPITERVLAEMGEKDSIPFPKLLLRASEMLLDYSSPKKQERIIGAEKVSKIIYKELCTAIRGYTNRNISGKAKVTMSDYEIHNVIVNDSKLVEDINPIQNIKEVDYVSYLGYGGRSKETLTKKIREFTEEDLGITSEATPDSGLAGVTNYLVNDPVFKNLRGMTDTDAKKDVSNLFSSTFLLSPGASKDDPKRVNFINIQSSHVISAKGYKQPYIRTGFESVVANRTKSLYSLISKHKGVVISKSDKHGIIIEYENGEREGVELGNLYGNAEGTIYPHNVITTLKKGDKFNKGDVICYNTNFFEIDNLDPTKIIYKNSVNARVIFTEINETYEDGSLISEKLAKSLETVSIKLRSITLDFEQDISNLVKVGDEVNPKSSLLIIEDEITSSVGHFDKDSLSKLKSLSKQTPLSKYSGTIDKIECFYNGDTEDISKNLRSIVLSCDNELALKNKAKNSSVRTGNVSDNYRVKGNPLVKDTLELRIYIKVNTPAGVGDKGIFGNQLKSVFSNKTENTTFTESGREIDGVFGYTGMAARVVNSGVINGTTTGLLRQIGKNAVKIYKGESVNE